jgi:alginate O-acetyltransferase complex protein AlgJ
MRCHRSVLLGLLLVCSCGRGAAPLAPQQWRALLAAKFTALHDAGTLAVKAHDGWYFLTAELHSYGAGPFWGDDAKTACVAQKDQDPLPAILEFDKMLKAKGIALILVPVPGKVSVYGDKLDAALTIDGRPDELHQQFYDILRKQGVEVLDLEEDFAALRKAGVNAYCRQDTHWSPQAVEVAARRIAEIIKKQPWYADAPQQQAQVTQAQVEVRGDLVELLKDEAQPREKLTVFQVRIGDQFIDKDPKSPLVLMGDSHTLVYHRQLLSDHGGLPDLLAAQTGVVADMIGIMGSGANGSRVALARRHDNMEGKKCVVWCFSVREFTESLQGWQHIPVIR